MPSPRQQPASDIGSYKPYKQRQPSQSHKHGNNKAARASEQALLGANGRQSRGEPRRRRRAGSPRPHPRIHLRGRRRCCSSLTAADGCSARCAPPPQQWHGTHLRRRCCSSFTAATGCSARRPPPRQPRQATRRRRRPACPGAVPVGDRAARAARHPGELAASGRDVGRGPGAVQAVRRHEGHRLRPGDQVLGGARVHRHQPPRHVRPRAQGVGVPGAAGLRRVRAQGSHVAGDRRRQARDQLAVPLPRPDARLLHAGPAQVLLHEQRTTPHRRQEQGALLRLH